MMNKYHSKIFWSEEDNGFIVTCPEFPGLSAFGETKQDALAEAETAIELAIESYIERGLELPAPQKESEYSGQFRVRLPKTIHKQAVDLAEREGVSLNQLVNTAITSLVSGQNTAHEICKEVIKEISSQPIVIAANNMRVVAAELHELRDVIHLNTVQRVSTPSSLPDESKHNKSIIGH